MYKILNDFKEKKILLSAIVNSAILSSILEIMTVFRFGDFIDSKDKYAYILYTFKMIRYQRLVIFFVLIINLLFMAHNFSEYKRIVLKHRWKIGLCVIAFCTIFKLHGSSIGYISTVLENTDRSNLFGVFRPIRSDEYVIFTEMAISQVKTGFKWFSDVWGYSPSDMFMVYGQPILNPVTIFRPFSVGYILLGSEMGLAFYWSSRFVVCLLVSFEFGRYITKGNNKLAFLYSFLVILSPVVQWWFSINELIEIIIFGQALILILDSYLKTDSFKKKAVLMLLFIECVGGYILSLYPAWTVSFFYVFLFFGIAVLIENKQKLNIKSKDLILILSSILVLVLSFLFIWSKSKNTILSVINTVYPGGRNAKGNLINIFYLFKGWTSYLWTIIEIGNPCEEVDFISLFPLGIVLSLVVLFKQKENDVLLKCLLLCNFFLIVFLLFNLPDLITSITMMKTVTGGRNAIAIGYLNLIILIRALTKIKWNYSLMYYLLCVGLISLYVSIKADSYLNKAQCLIALFVGTLIIILLLKFCKDKQNEFIFLMLSLSIIGGAFVNPISTGLDSIFETKIYKEIESINNKDEGLWAVVNGGIVLNNLPTTAGAHTVNAVATYPNPIFWEKIGMQDKEELWNRYAHINISLSEEEDLKSHTPDSLDLTIKLKRLKDLGVKYILVNGEIEEEPGLVELFESSNFRIYSLQ